MASKSNVSSNQKLQKTVSNLISTVITSLCQQIVQFDHSLDIFGVLNINLDNDLDISVKINEKYVKKDVQTVNHKMPQVTNPQISRILDIVQNTKRQYHNELANLENDKQNERDETIMEIINNCNKDDESCNNFNYKRRPRKPNQTFKHIIVDNVDNISKTDNEDVKQSSASELDENTLKIDVNYDEANDKTNNEDDDKMECNTNGNDESEGPTDDLNESKTDEIIDIETTNNVNAIKSLSSLNSANNASKMNYRCTVCDRQFKRKFCLTRHKRIHQNFKTYSCNYCGLGFDLINQLKRHLRNSHTCNRENLRRSCRSDLKIDSKITQTTTSSTFNLSDSLPTNWPSNNNISLSKPLINNNSILTSDITKCNPYNSAFSLINKRTSQQFTLPMSTPLATPSGTSNTASANTQHQVRQLLNNIMMAAEATNSMYSNPMYFIPQYSTLLPNYTQTSTAPTTSITQSNTTNINTTSTQKYLYPPSIFNLNLQHLQQQQQNLTNKTINPVPNLKSSLIINKTNDNMKLQTNNSTITTTNTMLSNNSVTTSNNTGVSTTLTENNSVTNVTSSNNSVKVSIKSE